MLLDFKEHVENQKNEYLREMGYKPFMQTSMLLWQALSCLHTIFVWWGPPSLEPWKLHLREIIQLIQQGLNVVVCGTISISFLESCNQLKIWVTIEFSIHLTIMMPVKYFPFVLCLFGHIKVPPHILPFNNACWWNSTKTYKLNKPGSILVLLLI